MLRLCCTWTGPTLSRINELIVSAPTVNNKNKEKEIRATSTKKEVRPLFLCFSPNDLGLPFHGDRQHPNVLRWHVCSRAKFGTTKKTTNYLTRNALKFSPIFLAFTLFKGRWTGVFQTGRFPDLDLSFLFCPFLSFLGLSRFFGDFPDLSGESSGIFPICPFPLSQPINSTYEEQSRKGPRHNLDLSRKKWETPGFGNPPASLKIFISPLLCGPKKSRRFPPKFPPKFPANFPPKKKPTSFCGSAGRTIFLTSQDKTQTMVRAELGAKLRPRQVLTRERRNSDHDLSFWGRTFPKSVRSHFSRTTPPAPTSSEHPSPDLIWTRFWPDSDLTSPFSGREIRCKSGPSGGDGRGQRVRSGWNGSVAPLSISRLGREKLRLWFEFRGVVALGVDKGVLNKALSGLSEPISSTLARNKEEPLLVLMLGAPGGVVLISGLFSQVSFRRSRDSLPQNAEIYRVLEGRAFQTVMSWLLWLPASETIHRFLNSPLPPSSMFLGSWAWNGSGAGHVCPIWDQSTMMRW